MRDFTNRKYVGPRVGDKILLGFIILSLYWHAAKEINNALKTPNIAGVLFMISILPGFTASSYMPALVLERPLYYRCAYHVVYMLMLINCQMGHKLVSGPSAQKLADIAVAGFMISILPGFTASFYMPALVLERPLSVGMLRIAHCQPGSTIYTVQLFASS